MRISFGELRIGSLAQSNLQRVIDNNWASEGALVKQFEDEWGKLFDYKHSVSMSSGTDACINACLALCDLGAQRGDEIICPALTFVATANSILMAGFVPKFVDIQRDTLNIDPSKIVDAITPKTKAIMVTHTMGKPCEMDTIMSIAKDNGLYVFEDACEAHGAQFKGKFVGKMGHVAMFSYYAAHIVVAGEGGMCSTDHDDFAELMRSTKSHGRQPGSNYFDFIRIGINSKMNDLEAAIGLEGVSQFWDTIKVRNRNKEILFEGLKPLQDKLKYWESEPHEVISPHAFPILLHDDDADTAKNLYLFLETNSIQCKTLFGSMPTQHKAFNFMGHTLGEFPEAEFVGRNGLHFGIHQYLSEDDMWYTVEKLHEFFGRAR